MTGFGDLEYCGRWMNSSSTNLQHVWQPSEELLRSCAMTRFMRELASGENVVLPDYGALHRFSVAEPEKFWSRAASFLGISHTGALQPLFAPGAGPTPLAKEWFPNARLNFVENLLRGASERTAIVSWSETRLNRRLSLGELRGAAGALQRHMASLGVGSGSRVFAYLPNVPESVVCMSAAASLGAAWASCGTDYQLQGLLSRAERIQPSVLVAARSFVWRGGVTQTDEVIEGLVRQVPSIKHVVLVDYAGPATQPLPKLPEGVTASSYEEFVAVPQALDLTKQFPFSQPLYLMFSSGTTGKPKGIVHGAGGTLLEHKKEMILHADVRPGDRLFYQTSTSWMMWNWAVSALACEATLVMYDGDPLLEDGMILWRMAEEERVTHFGTSAAFLGALEKQGRRPGERHKLSDLRALMSTGSTLYPQQFDYIKSSIKPLWIQSISGGTDIIGCFGLGCPIKPVIRGEVQCKSLGYDVQVFDTDGKPAAAGEEGELVCCSPAPSMPVSFLDDPGGEQYRSAYFSEYGSVWRHGDLVRETADGGLLFLGRSDATLKPSGVRVATADIYAALQRVLKVTSALAVGYTPPGATSEKIVLFVVLSSGEKLGEALSKEISSTLKASNAFFVPAAIIQAPDLPRTANNKLSELSVKRILRGDEPGNRSALANPESLAFFEGEGRAAVRGVLG